MPTTPSLYTSYRDSQLHYIHASAVFYGFADAGSRVQVWNGSTLLSTVTAKADGLWDTPPDFTLAEGSYHITAISIDASGNKSGVSVALDVKVDETPPAAPTIALEEPGTAGGLPTVFSGSAEPNAPVILDLGQAGTLIGAADASGHWRVSALLADGHYSVVAVVHDLAGNASPTVSLTFDRTTSDDVGNDAAHASALPVDATVSAGIDYFGDSDWFKVSLAELTTYTISLKAAKTGGGTLSGVDSTCITLWDPQANGGAGQFIFLNPFITDKADLAAVLPVMHSGDYYLAVRPSWQVGSYTLGVATLSHDDYFGDQARAVAVGANSTTTGHFDYSGDLDMFKVRLEAGKTYVFDLVAGAGVNNVFADFQVTDTSNTLLIWGSYTGEGHDVATLVAPATGDYYVSASYPGPEQGSYQLSIKEAPDDYGASPQNSGTLLVGASVTGVIEVRDDQDWFAVNLQAGTAYTFLLDEGDNPYGRLMVHDASGKQVSAFDTSYDHGRLLTWTPGTSGTYFVDFSSLAAGVRYALQARAAEIDDYSASPAGAGVIKMGQDTAGRLEAPTDTDWFKIPTQVNAVYTFQLKPLSEGSGAAPENGDLSVVDGAGHVLARASYWYGQTTLTWQADTAGDYYLAVSAYGSMYSYTIGSAVSDQDIYPGNPTTTGTLGPGGVVRSSLDFRNDTDWFKVDLQAGHDYTFQLMGLKGEGGTLAAPALQMYDNNKVVVWQWSGSPLDEPFMRFTAKNTGTFFLEVSANVFSFQNGTGTGTYTLKEGTPEVPLADTTPPKTLGIHGATFPGSDPRTDNFDIAFSEPVTLGSGTLTLRLATGEVVETFDLSTSARLTLQGDMLVVDPTAPLAFGTAYRISLDAAVKDKAGLPLAAPASLDFVTIDEPLNAVGGPGNDVYANTNNSDKIDGGAGLDTVVYKAASAAYNVYNNGQAVVAWGRDHDTLVNVERVVFNDGALAFDLDGSAGQAYRLYQASFNRTPDWAGLGFWIAQMDKGMTLHEAAQNFIASDEFKKLFGAAPSDVDFVKALYGNVLHRAPDQAGSDYWTGALQQGTGRADVLVDFSTSAENQAAVIGQISQGIHYLPYH